jgi:tetratricopeptide (TPR) repeat protein
MQLYSQPTSIIIILCVALFAGNSLRVYQGDRSIRRAASTVHQQGPANAAMVLADKSRQWVPEDARPYLIRAQTAYAMALQDAGASDTWLKMAAGDLGQALRRNAMDGTAFRTLALTAYRLAATHEAITFAHAAVKRGPSDASNQWVLARLLPKGSVEQADAYRRVTALRPDLTEAVLQDLADHELGVAASMAYVAPRADAYLVWAEGVTDPAKRITIATEGLRLLREDVHSARIEAWLSYYVGLGHLDTDSAMAVRMLGRAVEIWPREQAFHRNHGFALLKTGQAGQARVSFQKSLALFSDLANAAHLGLAKADEAMGNHESARGLYQRLAFNPRLEEWVRREARSGLARIEPQRGL